MRNALITGITGQDGSYLAELLLQKGYVVHGLIRRSSSFNTARIDPIVEKFNRDGIRLVEGYYGDLTDSSNLNRILEKVKPDEIYNLAAQSHVKISFEVPEYTAEVDALGVLRFLDAIKETQIDAKFYQASTSELFGKALETPQSERTPFYPRSPYGVAKLYAYWAVVNYREAYGLFASNGILFNHESPRRGENFVSRKITMGVNAIRLGTQEKIVLGNLDAARDWGYAADYVEAMWLMMQYKRGEDFVVATGESHSVREFVERAFEETNVTIRWEGEGLQEKGVCMKTGRTMVELDPRYLRPTEVDALVGDYSKARAELGWRPKVKFDDLVSMMVREDYEILKDGRVESDGRTGRHRRALKSVR